MTGYANLTSNPSNVLASFMSERIRPTLGAFEVDEDFDPAGLSPRPWFIKGLTMLGHTTLLLSPGGVGKSTLGITIGVGSALGRHHLIPGYSGVKGGNALILNSEDDLDEMKRRLAGLLEHHKINPAQLAGKLYMKSLYGDRTLIGEHDSYLDCLRPTQLFDDLVIFCRTHQVELIVLDPLVGFHNAEENANGAMEEVAGLLRRLARETGAAVVIIHHTRKSNGDSEDHAGDMDAGRGASALAAASRIAITLARMSKGTAKSEGIDWTLARNLRRIDDAKQNYAPSSEAAKWFEMRSTQIANGEQVPVPVPFNMQDISDEKAAQDAIEHRDRMKDQVTEVAGAIIGGKHQGTAPQPDAVAKLQSILDVGRSTAQDRLRLLPVGETDAYEVLIDDQPFQIWREPKGQTFTIHWREETSK